jgi:signal transduction histidine kinase/ActR/RegA family two-component response regulator
MLVLLFRDPILRASLAAFALQALFLFALPVGPRATVAQWSDSSLLALSLVALERAARAAATGRERRFWRLLAGAGALWVLASLLDLSPTSVWSDEVRYLATDALYLAISFLFIVTLGMRPEHEAHRGPLARAVAIDHVGTVVFAFALLGYFVVVPFEVNKPVYATLVPSMSAFVLLDIFLLARSAWLARVAGPGHWRMVYVGFAVTFAASLAHDGYQLVEYLRGLPDEAGSAWDLVWTIQFVGLAAAAAASRLVPPAEPARRRAVRPAVVAPVTSLVPFALALPLIHLAGRIGGLLDPVTESAREIVVLVATPVLAGLAVAHQALLERRHEQVRMDLLATQEALQQSRKMEALGRLAGGVAHDFNNLLAVILGYADMLLDRRRDDERVTGPAEEIRQAAERALAVTRQLTIFSQRQHIEGGALDLDGAVNAITPLLQRLAGTGVELECRLGAPGRAMSVDLHQFERVLINLVVNARDAMPGGGRVVIETGDASWADDDPARPRALPAGGYLRLSVSDVGPGMAADVRMKACDPFFTTKEKHEHPGLGLSVVYGIVMQAGGALEIDSEPGMGTSVHLVFPEVPVDRGAEGEEPGAPASGPRAGQATVLLAEDDRSFRELMRAALERAGYRVLEAADGRAALDVAARYEGRIDLLLTDLVMPGLDGRRLVERLTPGRPEMRVLFVSGYTADLLSEVDLAKGGRAFLQKPFTMNELIQQVVAVSGIRPMTSI